MQRSPAFQKEETMGWEYKRNRHTFLVALTPLAVFGLAFLASFVI